MRSLAHACRTVGLVALAAGASALAQPADVALSLNLRYADPADPSEGGSWTIVGKTTSDFGIAAVNMYLSNVSPAVTGPGAIVYGRVGGQGYDADSTAPGSQSVTAADLGAELNAGHAYVFAPANKPVNILYWQDITTPAAVVKDVGRANFAHRQVKDVLRPSDAADGTAAFDDATALISGSFSANRPAFASGGAAQVTDSTTLATGGPVYGAPIDANTSLIIRGDSLASVGLEGGGAGLVRGDLNRDFKVDNLDLAMLLSNFNQTGRSWDQGDVTDGLPGHEEGVVDGDDLAWLLYSFDTMQIAPGLPAPPPPPDPPVGAVPEPAGIVCGLVGVTALVGVGRGRRKRGVVRRAAANKQLVIVLVGGAVLAAGQLASASTLAMTQSGRNVTQAEVDSATLAGEILSTDDFIWEFFASTDGDILSIDEVVMNAPVYQTLGASDVEPPDPLAVEATPHLAADSWISTPGATMVVGGGFGSANSVWLDTSNDGPATDFQFARLTTTGAVGTFSGRILTRGAAGPEVATFTIQIGNLPQGPDPLVAADLQDIEDHFGETWVPETDPPLHADFDMSQEVEGGDVLVWQQRFGTPPVTSVLEWSNVPQVSAVPEPTAACLALAGVACGLGVRRRVVG